MNIYTDRNTKRIPKSLTECTKEDVIVSDLNLWADRLETFGKILFIIIIVIGIISTVVDAITTQEVLDEMGRYVNLDEYASVGGDVPSVAGVIVTDIIKWGLYAFLEFCIYHAIALLISALASITQNTIVTANVALYEAANKTVNYNTVPSANTSNENNIPYAQPAAQTQPQQNSWFCKNCGTQNKADYGQCKKCGTFR